MRSPAQQMIDPGDREGRPYVPTLNTICIKENKLCALY